MCTKDIIPMLHVTTPSSTQEGTPAISSCPHCTNLLSNSEILGATISHIYILLTLSKICILGHKDVLAYRSGVRDQNKKRTNQLEQHWKSITGRSDISEARQNDGGEYETYHEIGLVSTDFVVVA